jgi:2-alkyl-3-oxoalkanoate reductase
MRSAPTPSTWTGSTRWRYRTSSPRPATASGVDRFVVQSYCGGWNTRGATEDVPLADDAVPSQRESLAAIKELESLARERGAVLRYGNLYRPGASEVFVELVRKRGIPVIGDGAGVSSWLHVDDAASVPGRSPARRWCG